MKYQVLLSLKNNENIFKIVVCCSCDRHLKGKWVTITNEYVYVKPPPTNKGICEKDETMVSINSCADEVMQ